MERIYDKQIIILFLVLAGNTFLGMAQKPIVWKRVYDHCQRDETIITTLPPELEKNIRWSPIISKEQKEVIRYILWNMVYVEGGTMNMGENNDNPI